MKKLLILLVLSCLVSQIVLFTSCSDNKTTIVNQTVETTEKKSDYVDENGIGYDVNNDGTLKVTYAEKQDKITIPAEYDGKEVTSVGNAAFRMTEIKEVVLPDTITTIEDYAFTLSTELKKINIPEGVTYIGINAFMGCMNLKSVKLPDSLETIDIFAFDACGLTEIVIPENVKTVDQRAFAECKDLKKIVFEGENTTINENVFVRSSKVVVHAPKNSSAIKYAKSNGIKYKEI